MSSDFHKARTVLWGFAALSYLVMFSLIAVAGMRLDYGSILLPALGGGATAVMGSAYCAWRNMPAFRNMLETTFLGLLLTVPCIVSTYLAIGVNMPLADTQLAHLDESLGFHWAAFVAFVDSRPRLAVWLGLAYESFAIQLLGLPALLCCIGQVERAYRMVAGYALICFAASFIAVWFPAIGAYPYYRIAVGSLENINIHFGYFFLEQFNGVRDNPDFVFSMSHVAGILTFPSVHAAAATLCAWAAWEISPLRYPVLMLNVSMAISAISHGSHYLVDVPAGILLAAACIAVVRVVTRRPNPAADHRMEVTA